MKYTTRNQEEAEREYVRSVRRWVEHYKQEQAEIASSGRAQLEVVLYPSRSRV